MVILRNHLQNLVHMNLQNCFITVLYVTHILLLRKSQSLQTKHYTVQHTGQDQYLTYNKNWESLELNTVKQWNSMDFN